MYYAFLHRYGIGMRDASNQRIGIVRTFDSRAARDAAVMGNEDLEPISARTALTHMADALLSERGTIAFEWCAAWDCDSTSAIVRSLSANEIVEEYGRLVLGC